MHLNIHRLLWFYKCKLVCNLYIFKGYINILSYHIAGIFRGVKFSWFTHERVPQCTGVWFSIPDHQKVHELANPILNPHPQSSILTKNLTPRKIPSIRYAKSSLSCNTTIHSVWYTTCSINVKSHVLTCIVVPVQSYINSLPIVITSSTGLNTTTIYTFRESRSATNT